MKLQCKCHGISGACNMRTCWLAMQEFRLVAASLRRRYDGATRVQMAQDGSRLVVVNHHYKKPTRSDLIYLEQSPDFCNFDPRTGASVHLTAPAVMMTMMIISGHSSLTEKPHRRRTWTVQSYSPGGTNGHCLPESIPQTTSRSVQKLTCCPTSQAVYVRRTMF